MSNAETPPPPPPPPVFEVYDDGPPEDSAPIPGPPRSSSNRLVLWIVLGVVVLLLLAVGGALMVGSRIKEFVPEVQEIAARAQMSTVAMAVDEYERTRGELPAGLEDLREARRDNGRPYLDHVPRDPWGRRFQYRTLNEGRSYEVRSLGRDGLLGTDDDVVYAAD